MNKYGKLDKGNLIVCELKSVVLNGVFIKPVPTEWYQANGWKVINTIEKPNDGFDYSHAYAEDANTIYDVWTKIDSDDYNARKRKHEYENKLAITWGGKMMTVDQANMLYLDYLAEGIKVDELSELIKQAKASIRNQFSD